MTTLPFNMKHSSKKTKKYHEALRGSSVASFSVYSFLSKQYPSFSLRSYLALYLFYKWCALTSCNSNLFRAYLHQSINLVQNTLRNSTWCFALRSNVLWVSPWTIVVHVQFLFRHLRGTTKLGRQVLSWDLLKQLLLVR